MNDAVDNLTRVDMRRNRDIYGWTTQVPRRWMNSKQQLTYKVIRSVSAMRTNNSTSPVWAVALTSLGPTTAIPPLGSTRYV